MKKYMKIIFFKLLLNTLKTDDALALHHRSGKYDSECWKSAGKLGNV